MLMNAPSVVPMLTAMKMRPMCEMLKARRVTKTTGMAEKTREEGRVSEGL